MPLADHDEVLGSHQPFPHCWLFTGDTLAGRSENLDIFRIGRGGFRDFTRIAASDRDVRRHFSPTTMRCLRSLDAFTQDLDRLRSAIASRERQ